VTFDHCEQRDLEKAGGGLLRPEIPRQNHILILLDVERHPLSSSGAGKHRVQELGVTEIEQVVGDEGVVCLDRQAPLDDREPARVIEIVKPDDPVWIGRPLAEPEPDDPVALLKGKHPRSSFGRDAALAYRVVHAGARRVEPQPVIRTADHIAEELAPVQRCKPVWTTVAHRDRLSAFRSIEKHRLVQEGARHWRAGDFRTPRRGVPKPRIPAVASATTGLPRAGPGCCGARRCPWPPVR
jgi:hypothetical protein